MRLVAALAAAGVLLLSGCGDDVTDAVDQAQGAVDRAQGAVDGATEKAKALNELARVDKEFLQHPEKALDAARETCDFMDKHSDKAKQLDEVRDAFDPIGASDLEAAQARLLLKILNNEVCPLID
jgi:uncharacterized protein YceK